MREMNRIEPNLPAHAYKTYAIAAPKSTHFRPATCAEFECDAYTHGWRSVIDEATELGQRQAHYIRLESGRKFTVTRNEVGLTVFDFEAGQTCFAKHQLRMDRPEIFYVKGGDHRGNPMGIETRRHVRAADWVDDFAEHQQRIADQHERG